MRDLYTVFHQTGEYSFPSSVERMWKLCRSRSIRRQVPICPLTSAARGPYFGHEQYAGKQVVTGQLDRFSTFPNHLLLLLVL